MITIAVDVDGTLRDASGNVRAREDIRTLVHILKTSFSNARIIVWSGSGELYARQVAREIHIAHWVDEYAVKGSGFQPDITIDDQDITLGHINLRCGEDELPERD